MLHITRVRANQLTDQHVAALGVHLDLTTVGVMLPGFPAGTDFSFELTTTDYPRVRPSTASDSLGSEVTLEISGLIIDLHGDRPDGTRNTLHVEIDLNARAAIGIDPASNSIMAQIMGAEITKMVMEDERKATGDGFDVARMTQMVQDTCGTSWFIAVPKASIRTPMKPVPTAAFSASTMSQSACRSRPATSRRNALSAARLVAEVADAVAHAHEAYCAADEHDARRHEERRALAQGRSRGGGQARRRYSVCRGGSTDGERRHTGHGARGLTPTISACHGWFQSAG